MKGAKYQLDHTAFALQEFVNGVEGLSSVRLWRE